MVTRAREKGIFVRVLNYLPMKKLYSYHKNTEKGNISIVGIRQYKRKRIK